MPAPTEEQKKKALQLANRNLAASGIPTIPLETLQRNPQPLSIPELETTPPLTFDPAATIDRAKQFADKLTLDTEKDLGIVDKSIDAVSKRLTGRESRRQQLETERNVPQLTQTVNDLSSRLNTLQTEAQATPLQLQQDAEGRGITKGGLAPIQDAALRRNAISTLTTAAQLEAAQGNLSTALELVDRTVDQEFEPLQQELDRLSQQRNVVLDAIERGQIKLTEARELALAELENDIATRQQALDEAKVERVEVQTLAVNARMNGAPESTVRSILRSNSLSEALEQAGSFGVDPTDQQKLQSERALQAQRFASANASNALADQRRNEGLGNSTTRIENQSTREITATAREVFGSRLAVDILDSLSTEEARTLLLDYRDTQAELSTTLNPQLFYEQWKNINSPQEISDLEKALNALPG